MDWIRIQNVSKSFGVRELFSKVSFDVKRGERVGLVGPNGVGKSTLLKCIMGIEDIDSGTIFMTDGLTIGYLKQDVDLGDESLREVIRASWQDVLRIEKEMEALHKVLESSTATKKDLDRLARLQERFEYLGGYEYEQQSRRVIYSLGFTDEDLDTPASAFSGGQKTRINVAKALVRRPDFLLLDEPTNHLDTKMLEWLEGYLSAYRGGFLVVSHDRYFLDRVATHIVELNHERVETYKGNYSRYLVQKEEREKSQRRAYEKQQEYIKKQEEYIDKYRAGIKSKMARGRQSQLDRLERIDAPDSETTLQFTFPKPAPCANNVLTLQEVKAGYGDKSVLKGIDVLIRKGESVALIGVNGAGKSTMLKAIMGEIPLQAGHIYIGDRVQIGYFSQEHDELHDHWTVLEEVMNPTSMTEEQARNVLGHFLFRGDAVFSHVRDLSGGEKSRLALLKLFLEGDNFLILDEPTNHLDIPTREVVEDALLHFGGTYLVISHDRYFLDKIAKKTLELEDGKITEFHGDYSYYKMKLAEWAELEALSEIEEGKKTNKLATPPNKVVAAKEEKEPIAEKKAPKMNEYMREKRLEELESDIARLEATQKMYEVQMADPEVQLDVDRLTELSEQLDAVNTKLEEVFAKWEELQEA